MVTEQQMESIEHWALRLEDPGRPLIGMCNAAKRKAVEAGHLDAKGACIYGKAAKAWVEVWKWRRSIFECVRQHWSPVEVEAAIKAHELYAGRTV